MLGGRFVTVPIVYIISANLNVSRATSLTFLNTQTVKSYSMVWLPAKANEKLGYLQ